MIQSIGMVCGRCEECVEFEENMKAVQSFHADSRVRVQVGNDGSG